MKSFRLFLVVASISIFNFAQSQIDVNINLGKPPVWGPVVTTEEYYFLPDINSYYDIRQSQFIYLNNGVWIRNKSLPKRFRSYNLNAGNVIIIDDYRGRSPYSKYKFHKTKYFKENKKSDKVLIIDQKNDNGNNGRNGNGNGNKKEKKNK
jgi:hypothetical protein